MFNGTRWTVEAVGKAQADFYEFLNANEKRRFSTSSRSVNADVGIWKRPEEGMVKINVGAAVLEELNMMGTGATASSWGKWGNLGHIC